MKVQIPALALTSSVTQRKSHNLSVTLFPCQQHGDNNSNHLTGLLRTLKEVILLKSLTQRLAFYKPSGFLVLSSQPPKPQLAPFLPLLNFNCILLITQVGDSHKSMYEKILSDGALFCGTSGGSPCGWALNSRPEICASVFVETNLFPHSPLFYTNGNFR